MQLKSFKNKFKKLKCEVLNRSRGVSEAEPVVGVALRVVGVALRVSGFS